MFLKLGIYRKLSGFLIIAVVLGFQLGMMGLMWAFVVDSCITFFINAAYTKQLIHYSIPEQLRDMRKMFLTAGVMALLTYLVGQWLPWHDVLVLIVQIIFGVGVYVGLSLLFKVEELHTLYHILAPIQQRLFHSRKKQAV